MELGNLVLSLKTNSLGLGLRSFASLERLFAGIVDELCGLALSETKSLLKLCPELRVARRFGSFQLLLNLN